MLDDMNLYDKDDGFRSFTLDEANQLLPTIIAITEEYMRELEKAKETLDDGDDNERLTLKSTEILTEWSQEIVDLGVYPKGYFTVDFKSTVPDTLLCWTYGESAIIYTHKIYESFNDRIPIRDDGTIGFEDALN